MHFLDLDARRGEDDAADCFFQRGVEGDGGGRSGCGRGRGLLEELGAREQEFAVEFEDFVELGGDVGADYVFDADAGGLDFAGLGAPLLGLRVGEMIALDLWGWKWKWKWKWGRLRTSSNCAISRRCCLAFALSFCCTMRRRDMESLSCTLSLFWGALAVRRELGALDVRLMRLRAPWLLCFFR